MSIRGANTCLISAVAMLAISSGVVSADVRVDSRDSDSGVDSRESSAGADSSMDSRAVFGDDGAMSSADSATESAAPFYLKASAEAFNKFGFNGKGDSPTETYGYVLGTISGVYHKAFGNSQNLQIELGVAGAGMAWDSTRRASLAGEGGLGFNYIGFNPRYDGKGIASATNTKNYYVHNAHIAYEGENFHITGGRFSLDDGAYIVGLVEGVDAGVKLNSLYIKASGISSAALLGDGFFWDFTRAYTPNGLLSAQVGYDIGFLDVSAFYYYGISEYSAPGLDVKLRFVSADSGFASTTRLNAVFPIYDELVMSVPVLLGVLGTISGVYHKAFGNSQNLQIELGVAGAGMAWDSTRRASLAGEGGLGFNYIGFNPRYDGKGIASATNTKNYYVHNAHIAYEGENFHITGGRFSLDDGAYIVGLVEGVDAGVKLNSLYIKASGISSAALLGDGFFWDFTRAYTPNGLLSAQVGYDIGFLDVSAFYYYGISEYSAPGLDVKLRFVSADSGFASTTRLNAVFPIYDELVMSVPVLLGGFLKNTDGKGEGFTSSILARQDFDFATKDKGAYSVGVAVYKNIGLSQARVGLFGSPLGVNVWDNSVYALGTSLNGIVYPDALSAFVFTKARYEKLASFANALEVGLDGRYTTAPATEEYSLKLSINWEITQNFALGVIANYYTSIFKDARTLNDFGGENGENVGALRVNQHIDRSYVMSKISWRI